MQLGCYLLDTRKHSIIYKPDKNIGLECYVDADFASGWSQADSDNAENSISQTGYVIMYANCLIHWVSRLQTEIALSTAKAEYIALLQTLRDVIRLITLQHCISSQCVYTTVHLQSTQRQSILHHNGNF